MTVRETFDEKCRFGDVSDKSQQTIDDIDEKLRRVEPAGDWLGVFQSQPFFK